MNIASSSFKLFIANAMSSVIGILGIIYFSRVLGASEIGVFFLFQATLGILSLPADFGLRRALEKRISEGESEGEFLSSALILKLIPLSMLSLLIMVFAGRINSYIGTDIATMLIIAIVLNEGAELSMSVLRGELRVGETAIVEVVRQATWVGSAATLVIQGYGAVGLISGLIVGQAVMLCLGFFKISTSIKKPSKKHSRSLFHYGKFISVSSIGGTFYSWMDIAIIGLFLTQMHVGAYEVAWRVTAIVMLLSRAIATTIFPQVSHWDNKDKKDKIENTIRDTITPSLILSIPAFFGAAILSKDILGLIFGEEFTIAWAALIILMGEKVLQSVHLILGRSLQGIDRPDLAAYATIASVLVNLILNVALILNIGLVGAALSTAFSFILNTLLHAYFLSKYVEIKIPKAEIGWCLVSSLGMVIFVLISQSVFGTNNINELIIHVFLGVVVYGILISSHKELRTKLISNVRSVV